MSALTKIFVVLLVILSIIQTAGTVVWVNRQANFDVAIKNLNADNMALKAKAVSAATDRDLANTASQKLQTEMQGQIAAKQKEIDTLRATVTDRETSIAQLTNNLAQVTAGNKSANDALAVAQKTLDTQNAQIVDLRKSDLDLQKRYAEATFAINNLTAKYDVTNREARDANEQITQLQSELGHAREVMKRAGVSEANPRDINPEPLIRLEGIVRSKNTIGGIPVATISIGSADKVTKGMRFKVIDPNNSRDPFLGYLIVDRVEPNEAIGHLSGPRIGEVRQGVEVRTQL